ncbi:MAG: hypothetical protein A2V88_17625 [Elusimicrobia bacterium RBG_16_66_12]|nr:MAG: hypothetical protein A2V88_17625 [Elusimicrobia bacterium RBG_16_66_12]
MASSPSTADAPPEHLLLLVAGWLMRIQALVTAASGIVVLVLRASVPPERTDPGSLVAALGPWWILAAIPCAALQLLAAELAFLFADLAHDVRRLRQRLTP